MGGRPGRARWKAVAGYSGFGRYSLRLGILVMSLAAAVGLLLGARRSFAVMGAFSAVKDMTRSERALTVTVFFEFAEGVGSLLRICLALAAA